MSNIQSFNWEQPGRSYRSNGSYVQKYANVKVEEFDCRIEVVTDYDHDWTMFRGKFTDTWEEGALKNPRGRYDNRVYKYFVPDSTVRETINDYTTNLKYSIQAARVQAKTQVEEDMKLAIDPGSMGYTAVGVRATISFKGVELGDASVWGIEIDDSDAPYIDEVANEELQEALTEARQKLAELREN